MTDRDNSTARGSRDTPGTDLPDVGLAGGGIGTPVPVANADQSIIGGVVHGSPGGGDFDAAEAYGANVDADEMGGIGSSGPGTGAAGSRIGDDQQASAGAIGADLGPLHDGGKERG